MAKREKAKKDLWKRRIIISFTVFIILVIFAASFLGKRGWLEVKKAQKRKENLRQEIELLEKKRDSLLEEIRLLKKYPEAYEEEARKKLWLMDPEEKVVVKGAQLEIKGQEEGAREQESIKIKKRKEE